MNWTSIGTVAMMLQTTAFGQVGGRATSLELIASPRRRVRSFGEAKGPNSERQSLMPVQITAANIISATRVSILCTSKKVRQMTDSEFVRAQTVARRQVFKSFWHGRPLNPILLACLNSFVERGHQFELYSYGEVRRPTKVKMKPASVVLPIECCSICATPIRLRWISARSQIYSVSSC